MADGSSSREVGSKAELHAYPLELQCLYSDDCKTLMSKGHHDPAAFLAEVEKWNGRPLGERWGKGHHGWHRTVPDSTGEGRCLMIPAKPHARGAYPTTCIVDNQYP